MTGATPQVFDLLLGPTGPSPDGQLPGGDAGAVEDGPLFANLLGGFLEGQPLPQNVFGLQQLIAGNNSDQQDRPGQPIPLVEPEVDPLNTQNSGVRVIDSDRLPGTIEIAVTESPAPGEIPPMRPLAISLSRVPERSVRHSLPTAEGPLVDNVSVGTSKIADKLNLSLAMLPEAATLHNRSLKAILTGEQIAVEPGKYRIIESEVSKGQLNLTVVSSESSAEHIKLSLPLKTLLPEGSFSPGRTALSGFASVEPSLMEGPVLEDYISRLRLTSIQVETEVESPAPTDSKHAVLKLLGGLGDRQVLMLSYLDGNGLVGRRKARLSHTGKAGAGAVDIDEALLDPRPGAEAPAGRSAAARPWNDSLLNRPHPFAGKIDQKLTMLSTIADPVGENADTARMNELIGPDANVERTSADGKGLKIRTTRLSLPEDVRTALKPGGQSVTLRIEPEHLGPARLRLVMHNNVLKALVTVNSTQAKAMVEGSLDQLANQLSKADIQVERIEVALNSDSRHESFLHRRPRRQASLKSRRGVNAAPAAMTIAASENRYGTVHRVGAGGVNLLA